MRRKRITPWTNSGKRVWHYGLVFALWAGANCVALAWVVLHDSRRLEAEFGVPANVIRSYQSRTIVVPSTLAGRKTTIWYRFRPPPWSVGTRKVPLIVFLHGAGECGSDNVRQLRYLPSVLCEEPLRDSYPCAVLAPQCPLPGGWSQRRDTETDLLDRVLRMIDEVMTDGRIDPNRIYLTGLSMGGYGAWELALRAPNRFAALVPICGGGDESRAARLANLPLWAVHGLDDDVIPVSRTRSMIAAVENAGGEPRFLELPDVGHNSWDTVYRDDSEVLRWMFRQIHNPTSVELGKSCETSTEPRHPPPKRQR